MKPFVLSVLDTGRKLCLSHSLTNEGCSDDNPILSPSSLQVAYIVTRLVWKIIQDSPISLLFYVPVEYHQLVKLMFCAFPYICMINYSTRTSKCCYVVTDIYNQRFNIFTLADAHPDVLCDTNVLMK